MQWAMGGGWWQKGGERNGFKILCNMATKQKPEGRRTKVAPHQESNRAWQAEGEYGTIRKGFRNGVRLGKGGYEGSGRRMWICVSGGEDGVKKRQKSGKNSGKNSFHGCCRKWMQRHWLSGKGAQKGVCKSQREGKHSGELPGVEDRLKPKPEFHLRQYQHRFNANVFLAPRKIISP